MPSPSRVLLFLPLAYATLSTVEMGPRSFYLYDYLKRPAAATSGLACALQPSRSNCSVYFPF